MKHVKLYLSLFIIFFAKESLGLVGITAPTLSMSTCSFPSVYTNLGNIVIDEGLTSDFAVATNATLILTAPANFQFNAGVGSISQNGGAVNLSALSIVVTASTITITYTSGGTNRDDILTISGIQIRATAASSGNILRKASNPGTGSISGIVNDVSNFGSLSSSLSCTCSHTLRLTDTFGDGWNGGTVKVQVNGVDVLTNAGSTFTAGSGPIDLTFNAATGDVITVIETAAGSFESEMRAEVLDIAGGVVIASHNPVSGAGTSGAGNCPPPMSLTGLLVSQVATTTTSNCSSNVQVVRLEITTTGATTPYVVTQIQTRFTGSSPIAGISAERIYFTGTSNTFATTTLFGSGTASATTHNINGSSTLATGTNYFWLVYDLNAGATVGSTIDAEITQVTASATIYNTSSTPAISTTNPAGSSTVIICLTPGGVSSTTLWMKADAGTNTTTNNSNVSSWSSQSTAPIVNVTQGTASLQPQYRNGSGTGNLNRFNYNPYIYTDGSSNRLVQSGDIDLGNTTTGFSVFQAISEDNGIVSMDWYHSTNGNIKNKGDALMYINKADGSTQQNVYSANGSQTVKAFIQSVKGVPGAVSGNGKFNGTSGATYANGWRVASSTGLCIGSNLDNGEFMQGGMGEFIIIPRIITATEQLKIESYLAVKYGVTLGSPTNLSNYLSSDGTIIWNSALALSNLYQNDIIGLGRDDISGLLQKQSHYYDDTVRIYLGTLSATNQANSSSFTNDKSFVLCGSDKRKLCSTASAMLEIPSGLTNCAITSRLEREWKVTRTNMAQNYNMDIKLNACGNPTNVTVADLRLLVDDDGNFGNGGTQCYYNGDGTGIVISYSNPTITISNISITHIPNNATKYITIASVNTATPLPIELLYFEASLNKKKTVDITWETSSERDNDYFIVEKSLTGTDWTFLGKLNGAGTTIIPQSYYLEDKTPQFGVNYYRLKQIDFNGKETYSSIRSIMLENENGFQIYPNPANSSFILSGSNLASTTFYIYDNLGKLINLEKNSISDSKIEFNVKNVSSGIYYILFESENQFLKLIINH